MIKKRYIWVLLLTVIITSCIKDKSPVTPEENYQWVVDTTLIEVIVSEVDSSRIWQNMLHLTSYPDRSNFGEYIEDAQNWLYDYFADNRFSVYYHQYVYHNFHELFFIDSEHGWMKSGGKYERSRYDIRTTDGGNTWEALDIPLGRLFFINPSTGFLVANEDFSVENTFMNSLDGGQSWQKRSDGFGGNRLFFINEKIGWVINDYILYGTTDGGYHWQIVNDFNEPLKDLYVVDSLHIWIAGRNGVFRSVDGGSNWLNSIIIDGNGKYIKIMMNNLYDGLLLDDSREVYYTIDGGDHWHPSQIPDSSRIYSIYAIPPSSAWALGSGSLFYSSNSAQNWQLQSNREWDYYRNMLFSDINNGWISTIWGLYKTTDGGKTWNYKVDNLPLECTFENVVASIPGKLYPDQEIVLIGHFDTVDQSVGADDNASGLCALLEISDILSDYDFAYTIKIICFSAEEIGTYGSRHYAAEARERGDKIKAVLNFDTIGYWIEGLPRDLNIEYNAESEWLADKVLKIAKRYTETDTKKHEPYWPAPPDHRHFWDQGYSAVWFDEAGNLTETSPYVNTSEDLIDYVNKSFLHENIKVAVAAAADLAVPVELINKN